MLPLVKRTYHRILPSSVQVRVGSLRHRLRNLPSEVKNFPRYLNFRLTGRCNACQGKNLVGYTNPVVAQLSFRFYECRDCHFIFVAPPPNMSTVYAGYTMPDFGEGESVWNHHYLDSIHKRANTRGKLLEIGFGNGSFLTLARDSGWEVYGTELSQSLVKNAREELKLPNIRPGTVEELGYPDDFFDVVAGFNFLEHVPNPRRTLEELRRILRPSGIVALMCPNILGIYHLLMPEILAENDPLKISWVPPDHISYFNKTNLKILLESVGFVELADESHLMTSLWRQFEVTLGPTVTDGKLEQLISEIQSSPFPKGDARVAEYRQRIRQLIVERMTWGMLSDLTKLEPLLGAEVGILLLGKKQEG